LLIILGVIIVGIAIAVGLSLFTAQSVQANKDAMINDMNNIAAYCYQFKIRPSSMGGGQNSYVGCTLPSKLASNDNATYSISGATATGITITGTNPAYPTTRTVSNSIDSDGKWGATWSFGSDFQ